MWEVPKSVGQSGSARFSFNRSGPGLQPDTTARTSPQRTVKGSRPDLQHEMRPTVFGTSRIPKPIWDAPAWEQGKGESENARQQHYEQSTSQRFT